MKAREIVSKIRALGGRFVREGRGSHTIYECKCAGYKTTIPDHGSKDVPRGTQRAIERDLEPCFGKGWLR